MNKYSLYYELLYHFRHPILFERIEMKALVVELDRLQENGITKQNSETSLAPNNMYSLYRKLAYISLHSFLFKKFGEGTLATRQDRTQKYEIERQNS